MNRPRWIFAVAAAGVTLLGGGVMAQGQSSEEVKVQATRDVTVTSGGKTATGVPIKNLTLSYGVSMEGLNLSTHSGAIEAEKRVNDAALAACKELGRQYPDATPSEQECAKKAATEAMPKLHRMVAAAEKTSRG